MDLSKIEDGIKYKELFSVLPIMKKFHDEWKANNDCCGFLFQKDYLSIYGVRNNLNTNCIIITSTNSNLFKHNFYENMTLNGIAGVFILCGSLFYNHKKYLIMFGMKLSTILLIPENIILLAFSEIFISQFSMNIMDNEFYGKKFLESVDFINEIKRIHDKKAKAINKSDTLPCIKILENSQHKLSLQEEKDYNDMIQTLSKCI